MLLCLLISCLVSCDEIEVPESDDTPPTAKLLVAGVGEPFVLTEDSQPATRSVGTATTIGLIGIVKDTDGGVKNVSITGEVKLMCSGDVFSQIRWHTYLSQNPDDAEVGDVAEDERATALGIEIADFLDACPEDMELHSLSGTLSVVGENFHGGTVQTAVFSFSYPK